MISTLLPACVLLYLLIFPSQIFAADVVLNEFLSNPLGSSESDSEWIELYNDSFSSVDISGWKLDDDPSSAQAIYVIPSGTLIDAYGFKTFDSSVTRIQLSNSEDSVRLLSTNSAVLDIYTYAGTTDDVSIGRSVDGGGTWIHCAGKTKGEQNNCPLPTIAPTDTPTPTNTLTPTPTPTATSAPTATSVPTSTSIPIATPTRAVSPTPTTEISDEIISTDIPFVPAILGVEDTSVSGTVETRVVSKRPFIIAMLFVSAGLALFAIASLISKIDI